MIEPFRDLQAYRNSLHLLPSLPEMYGDLVPHKHDYPNKWSMWYSNPVETDSKTGAPSYTPGAELVIQWPEELPTILENTRSMLPISNRVQSHHHELFRTYVDHLPLVFRPEIVAERRNDLIFIYNGRITHYSVDLPTKRHVQKISFSIPDTSYNREMIRDRVLNNI